MGKFKQEHVSYGDEKLYKQLQKADETAEKYFNLKNKEKWLNRARKAARPLAYGTTAIGALATIGYLVNDNNEEFKGSDEQWNKLMEKTSSFKDETSYRVAAAMMKLNRGEPLSKADKAALQIAKPFKSYDEYLKALNDYWKQKRYARQADGTDFVSLNENRVKYNYHTMKDNIPGLKQKVKNHKQHLRNSALIATPGIVSIGAVRYLTNREENNKKKKE